jgi:2'-5' RNA ligase
MGERWRLFVALPIGEELRASLATAVDGWRDRPDLGGLRWTDPAAWHVTLHFLGATEPEDVPGILRALEDVAATHAPMRLATGALGGFPSAGRARVAWYGVAGPAGSLRRLADEVRRALAPDEATRFRPHVTVARARGEPVDLRGWIADADAPSGELAVDRMQLMRSHLGGGPARYETIAAVPIGAAVHV